MSDELMDLLFQDEARSRLEKLIAEVVENPLERAKIRAKLAESERKTETLSEQEAFARYSDSLNDIFWNRSPSLAHVIEGLTPEATKTLVACTKAVSVWLEVAELCRDVRKVRIDNDDEALRVLKETYATAQEALKLRPLVDAYVHVMARCALTDFGFLEVFDSLKDELFELQLRVAML